MKLREYLIKNKLDFKIIDLVDKNGNDIPERAERNQRYLDCEVLDTSGNNQGENSLRVVLDIENQ